MHNTALDQHVWTILRRAETHEPHAPISMMTIVDRGPILMYGCVLTKCKNTSFVYVKGDPIPTCRGGYAFSFSTTTKFDGEEG
jgi:hypothetical protein